MRIFSQLYNKVLKWSRHRHAPYYLAGVSFAESSMFPVPPDVMLISMALAEPKRAWYYAMLATVGSVVGGMLGYLIGAYLFRFIHPTLLSMGYGEYLTHVEHWFHVWGVWVVLLAGFSPIPYKLFTISAGAMQVAFWPFVLASLFGRGLRFYLVSFAMYWGGEKLRGLIRRYVDILGWLLVAIFLLLYLLWTAEII